MSLQTPFWHHDGSMMGWGGHWGWGIFWLVLAVVVVWGVARAMSSGGKTSTTAHDGAEESLRRRFAEGEITREEFEERLKVLNDSN